MTYVKLDGEVGILGNGAGLVDVDARRGRVAGGRPANFCDLGGGGNAEGVVDALEVITRDPQVKSIFFNIFGGITRCDEVARGILEALDRMKIETPIVVRLDGTNAEEGRRSSPTLRRRTCTSSRRCSTPPARRGARRVSRTPGTSARRHIATSVTHSTGDDLDAVVELCNPHAGVKALDVATGGGHVARRLREPAHRS